MTLILSDQLCFIDFKRSSYVYHISIPLIITHKEEQCCICCSFHNKRCLTNSSYITNKLSISVLKVGMPSGKEAFKRDWLIRKLCQQENLTISL